jgi:hypothetical protein
MEDQKNDGLIIQYLTKPQRKFFIQPSTKKFDARIIFTKNWLKSDACDV